MQLQFWQVKLKKFNCSMGFRLETKTQSQHARDRVATIFIIGITARVWNSHLFKIYVIFNYIRTNGRTHWIERTLIQCHIQVVPEHADVKLMPVVCKYIETMHNEWYRMCDVNVNIYVCVSFCFCALFTEIHTASLRLFDRSSQYCQYIIGAPTYRCECEG